MKKHILLIRHGTAEDADVFKGTDFERPLTKDGKKEVQSVSKFLKKILDFKIHTYISSPAIRAKQTLDIVIQALDKDTKGIYHERLYMKGDQEYINTIKELDESTDSICICGHNPDISSTISKICKENSITMEKGSIAIISIKKGTHWKDITSGKCKLQIYMSPKFVN